MGRRRLLERHICVASKLVNGFCNKIAIAAVARDVMKELGRTASFPLAAGGYEARQRQFKGVNRWIAKLSRGGGERRADGRIRVISPIAHLPLMPSIRSRGQ